MEDEVTISKFKATCLALLAKVMRTGPSKKPESWLGSFSTTGRITGDIMSPPVAESEWEASLGDTTSRPCR